MKKPITFEQMSDWLIKDILPEQKLAESEMRKATIRVRDVRYVTSQLALGKPCPEVILTVDEANGERPRRGTYEFSIIKRPLIREMLPHLQDAKGKTFSVGFTYTGRGLMIWECSPV